MTIIKKFFIIDGYNFLHAAGMIPRSVGPGTLSRSRKQLLHFLEYRLSASERNKTTIVFDVHQNKSEIPAEESFASMSILNAVHFPDADTCIEELILKHSAPKQLIVVSSDHRLHRAAKKRKAIPIDSEDFFEIIQSRTASVQGFQESQNEISDNAEISDNTDKGDISLLQESIHYPEEDLPDDVPSPLSDSCETDEVEFWEKRIQEFLGEN